MIRSPRILFALLATAALGLSTAHGSETMPYGRSATTERGHGGLRQMTRFERLMATPAETADDSTLVSLSDGDEALMSHVPTNSPTAAPAGALLEPAPRKLLAVADAPTPTRHYDPLIPTGEAEMVKPASGLNFWEWAIVTAVTMITLARLRIFRRLDALMYRVVCWIKFPSGQFARRQFAHRSSRSRGHRSSRRYGSSGSSSGSRRRRSRSQRGVDVRWYFRAASRNPRWRRSGRERDFVVSDVVYATAPASAAPPARFLLTYNDN